MWKMVLQTLCNLCTVKNLDFRVENSNRCSVIWVEFESRQIGLKTQTKYVQQNMGSNYRDTCNKKLQRWSESNKCMCDSETISLAFGMC